MKEAPHSAAIQVKLELRVQPQSEEILVSGYLVIPRKRVSSSTTALYSRAQEYRVTRDSGEVRPWRSRHVTGWPGTLRGDAKTAFSVELTASTDDLSLEVEGFGAVKFPVTPARARKLLSLGRPARFGRGEETLTDADVRDTWESPKHGQRWDEC